MCGETAEAVLSTGCGCLGHRAEAAVLTDEWELSPAIGLKRQDQGSGHELTVELV